VIQSLDSHFPSILGLLKRGRKISLTSCRIPLRRSTI
jgi:hypothetical protein